MSGEVMTRERFEALAEAYGGAVARWPEHVRDAAAMLMTAEPQFARDVLARAGTLDEALDAWRPLAPTAELRHKLLAGAPQPQRRAFAWISPAALAAGLAAACAAGVLVGVEYSQRATSSAGPTEQVAASTLSLEPSLDLEGA